MTLRTVVAAFGIMLLTGALALANVCPRCLRQFEGDPNQKYCPRCQAEMETKSLSSQEEKKLVDDLDRARADYKARLEALDKFYTTRGNADGIRKIEAELKDFNAAQHFAYRNWEDSLPDLSATTKVVEADKMLRDADEIRLTVNPFNRARRLADAAVMYREILQKYPKSTAVDSAAFGLGEIYSTSAVGEYGRAAHFYELCYLSNPNTAHDALFRAAQVYDDDLADYENAARYYWMASRLGKSMLTRERASVRLSALQRGGFGASYKAEEKKAEPSAPAAPAAAKDAEKK